VVAGSLDQPANTFGELRSVSADDALSCCLTCSSS
jgi:hypothetical protein